MWSCPWPLFSMSFALEVLLFYEWWSGTDSAFQGCRCCCVIMQTPENGMSVKVCGEKRLRHTLSGFCSDEQRLDYLVHGY
ncbi:hypothetical protein CEXT_81121 [Caerostris extrusa]|uniref:Secreted protein n=1 Tax=Caerostris extrusa TaxID=172846 RepID=A0AAV4S685_CAEEX|nr:hypothetical protein CEXT_81121 [Caerostris extrusa]